MSAQSEEQTQQAQTLLDRKTTTGPNAEVKTVSPTAGFTPPPTDGTLPLPARQADVDTIAALYDLNVSHIEHALTKLREIQQTLTGRAGDVLTPPHTPAAQDITHVKNGARAIGMEFEPYVDLALTPWDPTTENPSSGPFAGVFRPKTGEPFMILAFKGTTFPWEVTTDKLFSAVVVDPNFLYGLKAHQGMARNLLKPFTATGQIVSAFDTIMTKLEATAVRLKGSSDKKVPVYVTGHSLGAGYSIVAYLELVRRVTATTPTSFVLQDLWNYGAPRVFLAEGAKKLAEVLKNTTRHAYRAANLGDIVPTLPPVFGTHVDIGYKLDPNAAAATNYITVRESELEGRQPNDAVPSPDTWQKHWPQVYYQGIRKYLNPDDANP
ncbi:Alpha/Beta hydrolase protein [Crepidotus variabilis]|uniref:Alpha/Beta hydrolase protein n=1 Tax=Crepidotus variabilis TaxID=179855 RepID=A0A9P6EPN4_9AGAR|nr:Alpha/Beta hydrolase protein [Crepidotus variabilis]